MTDICPIVVEIQISRLESIFQIKNSINQVSPFFLGRTAVSESVLQIIGFRQFFIFLQSVPKKSKNLVSLFPTDIGSVVISLACVDCTQSRRARIDIVHIRGKSVEPCVSEILKEKKRVVDRRFSNFELLYFASNDKTFGAHKRLADNRLQKFFAKFRSEVGHSCSERIIRDLSSFSKGPL